MKTNFRPHWLMETTYPEDIIATIAIAEAGIASLRDSSAEYPKEETKNPPKLPNSVSMRVLNQRIRSRLAFRRHC
jgi:hypothetical protein